MKWTVIATAALLLVGCKTTDMGNAGGVFDGAAMAVKAGSLSDAEVVAYSDQACAAVDAESRVAPVGNKYAQRLNKVVAKLPSQIGDKKADYKVYLTKEVNAWAMANGCIRVYSGLMDLMNDDELRGVLGHEIGHVALGHSKKAMQTAYATAALRTVAANSGNGAVASLSRSQAGALGEKFINAQFSQSQETDADDYAFDFLTKQKLERKGLVTAFEKLGKLEGGGEHSMLSSHPDSNKRSLHMQERLKASK